MKRGRSHKANADVLMPCMAAMPVGCALCIHGFVPVGWTLIMVATGVGAATLAAAIFGREE